MCELTSLVVCLKPSLTSFLDQLSYFLHLSEELPSQMCCLLWLSNVDNRKERDKLPTMNVTDGLLMKLTLPSGNDLANKWATLASLETIHYQHPGHINTKSSTAHICGGTEIS